MPGTRVPESIGKHGCQGAYTVLNPSVQDLTGLKNPLRDKEVVNMSTESTGSITYCFIQKLLAMMKQLLNSHRRPSLEMTNSEDGLHPLRHGKTLHQQPFYGAVSPVGRKYESGNLEVEVVVDLLISLSVTYLGSSCLLLLHFQAFGV